MSNSPVSNPIVLLVSSTIFLYTTFLTGASPCQYSGKASRVTLSPLCQETNLYGPDPTGFCPNLSPASFVALSLKIAIVICYKLFKIAAIGFSVVTFTV